MDISLLARRSLKLLGDLAVVSCMNVPTCFKVRTIDGRQQDQIDTLACATRLAQFSHPVTKASMPVSAGARSALFSPAKLWNVSQAGA